MNARHDLKRDAWKALTFLLSSHLFCQPFGTFPKHDALNLVFVGDSITYGGMLPAPEAQSPPVICASAVRKLFANQAVYLMNEGHSGHTTVDFLPSTSTDFPLVVAHTKQMIADHAGHVLFSIMLGTNDSAESGTNGAPVSPQSYATNLKTMISGLRAEFPDATFVLNRPLWYSRNTANGADYGAKGFKRLQQYSPQIATVARSFPDHVYVGDTRGYGLMMSARKRDLTPEIGRHGTFYLHPNPRGAKLLGELWAEAIYSALDAEDQR